MESEFPSTHMNNALLPFKAQWSDCVRHPTVVCRVVASQILGSILNLMRQMREVGDLYILEFNMAVLYRWLN